MSAGEGDLAGLVGGMEEALLRLEGLSKAVTIMGERAASQDVDASAVWVMGHVLEEAVGSLRAQWQRAFDLSRQDAVA